MNLLTDNIIVKGGWVMAPIILGSIIALGLAIERGIHYFRIRLNLEEFTEDIFFLVEKGEFGRAIERCEKVSHPIGAVLKTGLKRMNEDISSIERAMENEGSKQVSILEKNFTLFMIIIGIEPMLGFLGTIVGLIGAFMAWERYSTTITVDQLAAGIYQAMITTAGGLIVAIPLYIIYNYYIHIVTKITMHLNYYSEELRDLLNKKKNSQI